MKRLKIILLFFVVNFAVNAQTFYCTKTIKLKDCKVSFANSTTSIWAQLDAKTMTWSVDQVGSYVIKDGNTQVTIKNDGCLTSPTFVALKDSLNSWQSQCVGSGGTVIPIPLIVENIGIDTVRVIDSVRVWFERNLDTSNQGVLNNINATLNDSIRVYFADKAFISDTANQGILNGIFDLLLDSLDKNVFINNDSLRVYFQDKPFVSDTANQFILSQIHDLLVDSLDKNIFINNDSIRVYFEQLASDTANKGILQAIHNILSDSLSKHTTILNDSLKVWFSQPIETKTDTANQAILQAIYTQLVDSLDKTIFVLNDSLRVYFNQVPQISDTANQGVLNSIFNLLLDSLDKQLYVLNPYIDSAIVRRMDTIIDRLTTTEKLDTLKGLVYTASAKVRTNRDTLYNCKSISFGRKSTASGTLILTFENGESESFNVANDDLPAWVNGEFISYLDYNATGTVGLIVNTLGCSQTDTEICAKVKPIFDCDLVIPITCLGWQSASGVWQTISGCWNTGQ